MGNWSVSVQGIGCHHNGAPYDVEALTAEFVKQLKAKGHTVEHVNVTAGGKAEVKETT